MYISDSTIFTSSVSAMESALKRFAGICKRF